MSSALPATPARYAIALKDYTEAKRRYDLAKEALQPGEPTTEEAFSGARTDLLDRRFWLEQVVHELNNKAFLDRMDSMGGSRD